MARPQRSAMHASPPVHGAAVHPSMGFGISLIGWGKTRKILNPTFRVNPTYFSRVRFRVRVSKIPFKQLFFDQETFLIYQVKTVITRLPNGQQINCVADNRPEKISAKSAKFLYKAAKVSPEFPFLSQNLQN